MSLILKGIDLPKKIKGQHGVEWECETYIELYVRSDGVVFDDDLEEVGQAIQIPTPHGRLIDGDELSSRMYHEAFETDTSLQKWDGGCWIRYKMFENCRDSAPTILEAEGER